MKKISDNNAVSQSTTEISAFDAQFFQMHGCFCGVDEAGRGPLAGDVYAAAVILPMYDINTIASLLDGVNDSKKLSPKRRDALFARIVEHSLSYSIATATVQEISDINIRNASLLAMQRAVGFLGIKPNIALIDGDATPTGLNCIAQNLVKGDSKSLSVAAASILAKVSRDRYMENLDRIYPAYGFKRHKGYGTAAHISALCEFGPTPVHRALFIRKWF